MCVSGVMALSLHGFILNAAHWIGAALAINCRVISRASDDNLFQIELCADPLPIDLVILLFIIVPLLMRSLLLLRMLLQLILKLFGLLLLNSPRSGTQVHHVVRFFSLELLLGGLLSGNSEFCRSLLLKRRDSTSRRSN